MSLYTRHQSCYLMKALESGYVKVGIANNVDRRLREVQSQFFEPIQIECATLISPASPVSGAELERLIHWKLAPYGGFRKEWFKVDVEHAITVWAAAFRFLAMPVGHPDMVEELCGHFAGQMAKCFDYELKARPQ